MKLSPDKLATHLKSGRLAPVYLIAGDEPLQVNEAADAIRVAATAAGFSERERHVAERGFDWGGFAAGSANLSLFAERRLVELRLPTGKPGLQGAKVISEFVANIDPDTLLLILTPKLDRSGAAAKWVKAVEKTGAMLQLWPVGPGELPAWIRARMRAQGLRPSADAVNALAERVEGNLLAANQEIEKLKLLHGEGDVDLTAVAQSVADSARYDVFQLGDAALVGDLARALRVLAGLRGEGMEPPLILWMLVREIRTLASLAWQVEQGGRVDQVIADAHVWSNRRALVRRALGRFTKAARLHALLKRAARADRVIKGQLRGNGWEELTSIVAGLAGMGRPATPRQN